MVITSINLTDSSASFSQYAVSPAMPEVSASAAAVAPAAKSASGNGADSATSQQQKAAQSPEKALESVNQQMKAWQTQLQFSIDPDLHRVVMSIVDSENGDVISTIPSEVLLHIARLAVKLQGNSVETQA
jgi:flagellar protein FlaG